MVEPSGVPYSECAGRGSPGGRMISMAGLMIVFLSSMFGLMNSIPE